MFKPFAMFCPTCGFVFRMKRPGQFTECPCGNAVDAGDGFIRRTIGDPRRFLTEAQMEVELYRPECDTVVKQFADSGKDYESFDIHGGLQDLIGQGMTRQQAKAIMYGYLYSEK